MSVVALSPAQNTIAPASAGARPDSAALEVADASQT